MSDYSSLMGAFIEEYQNIYSDPVYKNLLSEEGRKSLTRVRYVKPESKYHVCPILFVEFEEGEEITELPCNHRFNSSAIEKWLTEEKAECPVCRLGLEHTTIPETPRHTIENIPMMPDIDAALALIDSINRATNMNRIYEYRSARVMDDGDDDELQEAIIASLNDLI
jgi:hypothetical protein